MMNRASAAIAFCLLVAAFAGVIQPLAVRAQERTTVRDRLWIWGHPAQVYNHSYLAGLSQKSTIEPVAAAQHLGLENMIFVRYDGQPEPPFADYYTPFRPLRRVYWSLVAAGGETSADVRDRVFELAEAHDNIRGFILDDFFHESAAPGDPHGPWLAENGATFPVLVTLKPPAPVDVDAIELVQSNWPTGDYRTKDFAIEVTSDGQTFTAVAQGTLPNTGGAVVAVALPAQRLTAVRIRILSTHDTAAARSCGLSDVRLSHAGQGLDLTQWQATASSSYPGFDAAVLTGVTLPFRASLTPQQLHELGQRRVRGQHLPIMAVVYSTQISPRAQAHLDEVDEVCLWTWKPADLASLEENLTALEKLVPGKPIYQGCYMFDFDACRPLPVETMQRQTELGLRWLKQGRVKGLIFLATPNVDVGLEAVTWTRHWIAQTADEPL